MLNSPLIRRGRLVVINATRHLMVPLENLGAAWLVVVFRDGATEWGAFVGTQIVVGLVVHALSWGNKDWMLRRAAAEPASVGRLWQRALWTRARFLPIAVVIVLLLGHTPGTTLWVVLWVLAAFLVQSLDAPVLISRTFKMAIAVEVASFAAVVWMLLQPAALGEAEVIRAMAVGAIVRAVLLMVMLVKRLGPTIDVRFEPGYLAAAAPFFLLGLSGMLQSKMDLYMANLFLGDAEIGRYQVIVNTFIMIQAAGAFLVVPFAKTLYRVGDKVAAGFARSVMVIGIGITVVGVGASWVLLNRVYFFDLGPTWFVLGALLVIPVFGFVTKVYRLYRVGRERSVAVVSFVGAAVNLVVSVVLLQRIGGIGALAGSVVSQWVTLLMTWSLRTDHDIASSSETKTSVKNG